MNRTSFTRSWRTLYRPGLELLRADPVDAGWRVRSTIVQARVDDADQAFSARYDWLLDFDWQTIHLRATVFGVADTTCFIERSGARSWRVDGRERVDLDGCEEIDISATPFCNTLAIHQMGAASQRSFSMLYLQLPGLALRPFNQSYERVEGRRWRYTSAGSNGPNNQNGLGGTQGSSGHFEALLDLDTDGFVEAYEGLFERVE